MASEIKSTESPIRARVSQAKRSTLPVGNFSPLKKPYFLSENKPLLNESELNNSPQPVITNQNSKRAHMSPIPFEDSVSSGKSSRKASIKNILDAPQKLMPIASGTRIRSSKGATMLLSNSQYSGSNFAFKRNNRGVSVDEKEADSSIVRKGHNRFNSSTSTSMNQSSLQLINTKIGHRPMAIKKPVDTYDQPLDIVVKGVEHFQQTMKYINEFELKRSAYSNQEERLNFVKSEAYTKFLKLLKDSNKMPKIEDENFYTQLENQLKEHVRQKTLEYKMTSDDLCKC